jgi:putative transposase
MDTHQHAVLETSKPNLGAGMKQVLGGHSRWFDARHGREGSVFSQHFWSRRITSDAWLLRACLYVVLNPVVAGLCAHPREWPWCSYRSTACGDPSAYGAGEERLLGLFGDSPADSRWRYTQVVDDAVALIAERRASPGAETWRVVSEIVRSYEVSD